MNFNLEEAIEVLERTPAVLEALLLGLSQGWLDVNEGEGTWNPKEVVAHLIEAEKTNWIPRLQFILEDGSGEAFPTFDRFAHLNENSNESIQDLISEFKRKRIETMNQLRKLIHSEQLLNERGKHPEFGNVKVRELISTWVVHDFTHISQIVRVMAKRYRVDVGPWKAYLGVLKQ